MDDNDNEFGWSEIGWAFVLGIGLTFFASKFVNKGNNVDPIKLAEYTTCINRVEPPRYAVYEMDHDPNVNLSNLEEIYSLCESKRP